MNSVFQSSSYAFVCLAVFCSTQQYSLDISGAHLSVADPLLGLACLLRLVALVVEKKQLDWKSIGLWPLFVILGMLGTLFPREVLRESESQLSGWIDLVQYFQYLIVIPWLVIPMLKDSKWARGLQWILAIQFCIILCWSGFAQTQDYIRGYDISSGFGNGNVLSGYFALACPILFGISLRANLPLKISSMGLFLLALFCIPAGGAILSIFFATLFMAAWKGRKSWLNLLLIWGLFFIGATQSQDGDPDESYLGAWLSDVALFDEVGEPRSRYSEWQAAFYMFQDYPLLGVGLGQYQDHIGEYFRQMPNPAETDDADNNNFYLVSLSSLGWPTFLCFLGLIFSSIGVCLKQSIKKDEWAFALLGCLLGFVFYSMFTFMFVRGLGVLLGLIFGYVALYRQEVDQEKKIT